MQIQIKDNGNTNHAALLKERISARIPVTFDGGLELSLRIDGTLGTPEAFQILKTATGYELVGNDSLGLYFGIGKFLHTASWSETDFVPHPPVGISAPACSFRAMYFAIHLNNWYAEAPAEELCEYVDDLLLWGYNTIVLIVPVIDLFSFDEELCHTSIRKSRAIFRHARAHGMKVGIIICPNQGLRSAPHEFDADPSFDPIGNVRGNAGRNLCPAKEGVTDYLRTVYRGMLGQFADIGLDYLVTWPYDEGGCGCAACRPWGANGYVKLIKLLREEALSLYPEIQMILSTWTFDRPDDQGEYAGLYAQLDGFPWLSYLMVDAHESFPRYPLEHERKKPIVNFPEISMWKLYPWGGYGANPLPKRFEEIWNSSKAILSGGMPYSEGMYEDLSKIQFAGYYWEPDRSTEEILSEYLAFEVDESAVQDLLRMLTLIEENHTRVANRIDPDPDFAAETGAIARRVSARLGARAAHAWRWRILYIRAILDEKRYAYYCANPTVDVDDIRRFAADFLAEDEEAQELFRELRVLYHSVPWNGRNHHTLPFVGGGTVLGGGRTYADVLKARGK